MKKKKILHGFVNYGTQSGILARGLREKRINAISITYSDKFKRETDIVVENSIGLWAKIINRPIRLLERIKWFLEYDIFHFYFGASLFPFHFDFFLFKIFGKKVICHYLGNDVQGFSTSVANYKWTNMPGFLGNNNPKKYDNRIKNRLKIETRFADLQIVCAPIYSEFVPNSLVVPLALNLNNFKYTPKQLSYRPIVSHAPTNRGFKGTDYIQDAVSRLFNEGYDFEFRLIENVTHEDLKKELELCDLFIDQIMAGWYGTAAIEAMAIGRPVICSIRKSYFENIDFAEKIPILHADPDIIYDVLKEALDNKVNWPELGLKSRTFIEEIHDDRKVVNKLIELYKSIGICVE